MSKAIGIDLGTTNSVVSVYEGTSSTVIPNAEGGRTTPSVVAYTQNERLVGQIARRQAVMNPTNTVASAKRFIGRRFEDATEDIERAPYTVVKDANGFPRFEVGGDTVAPEQVSAQILKKLAKEASDYLGEKVTEAVITVPAYFNDAQRTATRRAGEIAGLKVLRIVNEPTAAALAYGADKKDSATALVFDLGGGTFDVSVLDVGDGICEVRATSGDTRLGGDDFDAAIVEWMAAEFKADQGVDLLKDPQALQRLYEAAEKAKIELSTRVNASISLPFITADGSGPKHLNTELSRAKFEQLTEKLVERTLGPVKQALKDAGIGVSELDDVLLVGGSTRIPAVQKAIEAFTGKKPNMSVNPDEVVAMGAALQAGILQGEVKDVLLLDVSPLSLGIEPMGGVMTKVIPRNTTIPAKRSQIFSTAVDNQPQVGVVVLQGERENARDNKQLGHFVLEGIRPAPRGTPQIEVTFDIDANGIVSVTAKDLETGKDQQIRIENASHLDENEVKRMVKDAEEHAEDDRKFAELAKAKNRADALVHQTKKALDQLGDVPATLKDELEGLAGELETLVGDPGVTTEALNTKSAALEARLGEMAQAAYQAEANAGGDDDDDVVDADFTEAA